MITGFAGTESGLQAPSALPLVTSLVTSDGEADLMKPSLWRIVALIGLVVLVVTVLTDLSVVTKIGDRGFTAKLVDADRHEKYVILSIRPDSPATRVLAVGDTFELVDQRIGDRMRYLKENPGDVFQIRRERAGTPTQVVALEIGASHGSLSIVVYVDIFLRVVMGLVAAVIVVKRSDLPEGRALASFFILFALALSTSMTYYLSGIAVVGLIFLQQMCVFAGLGQAVRFATIFPTRTERGVRAFIRRINPYFVWGIVAMAAFFEYTANIKLEHPPGWLMILAKSPWVYYVIAITTAFVIASWRSTGEEKQRTRWVSLSLAVGFSGLIAEIIALLTRQHGDWIYFLPMTELAIPFGMGYAILRYRVLDIGFVVNRAIVFGGVSIVIVLVLGALEWFLGKFLVDISHTTSSIIELSLSLVLGLSLKSIHHRVDRFVDDFFFRERHESEAAIRRFATEASFITDLDVLENRAIEVVARHAHAARAAMYLAEPNRFVCVATTSDMPTIVDENDPAVVRMRAFREPLILQAGDTSISGERAFPLIVRGHLTGMLVIGPKRSAEPYAPDEAGAIAALASAVGTAIDVLQTESLKREVDRILRGSDGSLAELRAAWERTTATSGAIVASQGIILATSPPQ